MTDTTVHFDPHARPAARQGALVGAYAAHVLLSLKAAFGAARGAREEAQRDASAVRLMAQRYRQSDRGFAADLDAAADRHEEALAKK